VLLEPLSLSAASSSVAYPSLGLTAASWTCLQAHLRSGTSGAPRLGLGARVHSNCVSVNALQVRVRRCAGFLLAPGLVLPCLRSVHAQGWPWARPAWPCAGQGV